jgi:hypothetical protein
MKENRAGSKFKMAGRTLAAVYIINERRNILISTGLQPGDDVRAQE